MPLGRPRLFARLRLTGLSLFARRPSDMSRRRLRLCARLRLIGLSLFELVGSDMSLGRLRLRARLRLVGRSLLERFVSVISLVRLRLIGLSRPLFSFRPPLERDVEYVLSKRLFCSCSKRDEPRERLGCLPCRPRLLLGDFILDLAFGSSMLT